MTHCIYLNIRCCMQGNRILLALLLCLAAVLNVQSRRRADTQIAFISDAHIQDVIQHPELLRSMEAQVQSTRLYNENIFALRAALDDAVRHEIRLVVLTGDLTDDGQPVAQQAAANILHDYEQRYGMQFFLTPGNHDPKQPFGMQVPMKNLLQPDGSTRTDTLSSAGHQAMMDCYRSCGYFPRPDYLYWETPFSNYRYEEYDYAKATKASSYDERTCNYADTVRIVDASYLVEPIEGLWLLSIDAGVYLPSPARYKDPGPGYNLTLRNKPYLLPWIQKVYAEARRLGKRVIAFSHYPLLDFNRGASSPLARSWGENKFDIDRVPDESVSKAFLQAGMTLHFGGHMHVYDQQSIRQNGHTLRNIQIPSLATGVPAYLILRMGRKPEVKPVVLTEVPDFDRFFPQYEQELRYTQSVGHEPVWSTQALQSQSYQEWCDWQMRDLVRTRFAKRDLPEILQHGMLPLTGQQLLRRMGCKHHTDVQWTGLDLLTDFYRLHYSGPLALSLIPQQRLKDYERLFNAIGKNCEQSEFMQQMKDFAEAFRCFQQTF